MKNHVSRLFLFGHLVFGAFGILGLHGHCFAQPVRELKVSKWGSYSQFSALSAALEDVLGKDSNVWPKEISRDAILLRIETQQTGAEFDSSMQIVKNFGEFSKISQGENPTAGREPASTSNSYQLVFKEETPSHVPSP